MSKGETTKTVERVLEGVVAAGTGAAIAFPIGGTLVAASAAAGRFLLGVAETSYSERTTRRTAQFFQECARLLSEGADPSLLAERIRVDIEGSGRSATVDTLRAALAADEKTTPVLAMWLVMQTAEGRSYDYVFRGFVEVVERLDEQELRDFKTFMSLMSTSGASEQAQIDVREADNGTTMKVPDGNEDGGLVACDSASVLIRALDRAGLTTEMAGVRGRVLEPGDTFWMQVFMRRSVAERFARCLNASVA